MIQRLHRIGLRFLLMLGGEVLQSAFGFALNVSLARLLPAEEYGVFAIVVLLGGFGLIYMRALIGVPACTFIPQSRRLRVARAYTVTFGSGALMVSLTGALVACCGLVLWRPHVALAGGAFIGAWSLRFYIRMALFAQGKAVLATLSDFIFTMTAGGLCAFFVFMTSRNGLLPNVFFALTFAHAFSGATALVALGQPIRISFRYSMRRHFAKLLPSMTWSIISVTMANLQGQGALLLLAFIAGPAAYAPIAATMAFFSPLRLATMALANMIQPDFAVAMARPKERSVMRIALSATALILVICCVYGLAMLFAFPVLSHAAFAGRFGDAPLGLIAANFWCAATAAVLYSVPKTVMETAQDFKANTIVAFIAALIGAPIVVAILWLGSPTWSLIGIAISELSVLIGSWIVALALIRRRIGAIEWPVFPKWRGRSRVATLVSMAEMNPIHNSGVDL